ncbi:DUF503 domain-containing protein [Candidatus Mcinerneyibacteriota bacterium]|nr:DUF503 domain-containing protein [Candidatus Mcinerneyibacteriota bacterium]
MYLLLADVEIYLHGAVNLKQKRMVLKSYKDHMKNKFDLIVREERFQDKWQHSGLVMATLADNRDLLDRVFRDAVDFLLTHYDVDIIEENWEIVDL